MLIRVCALFIVLFSQGVNAQVESYNFNYYNTDEYPVYTNYTLDSNFTVMSYSLPNNPRSELIYNDHLYLGCGPILKMFEIGIDGQLTLTGQIQTHDLIWDMEHGGEYLYVANYTRGLTIYEGNDFVAPSEVVNFQDDCLFLKLCLYGDSLLFSAENAYFGIVSISDPHNPYLELYIDDWSFITSGARYKDLFVYEYYMIADVVILDDSPMSFLAVYDLNADSVPVLVDTVGYDVGIFPITL